MRPNEAVARRYANALFQLSSSGDHSAKPAETLQELQIFLEAFSGDDELRTFLTSPVISREAKRDVLTALETKLPNIYKFLVVLADSDRVGLIREIVREFYCLTEESRGELNVKLETARKFPDSLLNEIKALLETTWRRKVRLDVKLNPNLLGGFVASANGKIFNASARAQLEALGEGLASGN